MDLWVALIISIPVSVILAFIGIIITNRHTSKMGKQTTTALRDTTAAMITAAREDGVNCIDKGIQALAEETKTDTEAVMKVIQANGEQTLKAIEKDGVETRKVIADAHHSIKEELGK